MTMSAYSASALAEIIVADRPVNHAIGTNGADHIEGYASAPTGPIGNILSGRGGNDYILSDVWADGVGVDGFSVSNGDAGNDTLLTYVTTPGNIAAASFGGAGNDYISMGTWTAGSADVRAIGGGGNDRIEAIAYGSEASILVRGAAGRDKIFVETNDEAWVSGGSGNDSTHLSLESADTFVFAQSSGNQGDDVVRLWDVSQDRLLLMGWDGEADVSISRGDVLVEFTNGSSIRFVDVGGVPASADSIYDLVDDPGQIVTSWPV